MRRPGAARWMNLWRDCSREELLTMPQKRIVLNVEDAALPRALRRALADALYDAGAEKLAFAPSIACAAVGGDAPTSIVVDVGSSSTRCAAVVDGFLLDATLAYADGFGVDAVAAKLPYETLGARGQSPRSASCGGAGKKRLLAPTSRSRALRSLFRCGATVRRCCSTVRRASRRSCTACCARRPSTRARARESASSSSAAGH